MKSSQQNRTYRTLNSAKEEWTPRRKEIPSSPPHSFLDAIVIPINSYHTGLKNKVQNNKTSKIAKKTS